MGKINTTPQVTQKGQQSAAVDFELTYGGLESPFGGIDSTAPPAYIDPRCFVDGNGFLVINNKLCTVAWTQLPVSLFGTYIGVTLLKIGTFYNSLYGQINYALGVLVNPINSAPRGQVYTFILNSWKFDSGGNLVVLGNDLLNIKLFNTQISAVPASLTIPLLQGESSGFIDSGTVGLNYGTGVTSAGIVTTAYSPASTVQSIVTGMVSAINAVSGSTGFTAAPSVDGNSIILTAVTPGTGGNSIFVADTSSSSTTGNVPAFYFPTAPFPSTGITYLQGGTAQYTINAPSSFNQISAVSVGGIVYFGNLGPMILKFAGPGSFAVSTMYAGAKVLGKYGGSILGLGNIPQLGNTVSNSSMILSWSAANEPDIWDPTAANGDVTGAGFNQLDDISDYLTGLVISNSCAYIIRSQGISYASLLDSGVDPFDFQNLSASELGEGSANAALICQYDQTGMYVGNTEIFQIAGSNISAIGDKIRALLIPAVAAATYQAGSVIAPTIMGGAVFPLAVFSVGNTAYLYNTANKTWMIIYSTFPGSLISNAEIICDFISTSPSDLGYPIFGMCIAFQYRTSPTAPIQTALYTLTEGVPNSTSITNAPYILFPQEELMLGRDVTINALYLSLWANVSEEVVVNFSFGSSIYASYKFEAANWNTLEGNPTEVRIYPNNGMPYTAHSPQLKMSIVAISDTGTAKFEFAKVQLYGSFDPTQKPVL